MSELSNLEYYPKRSSKAKRSFKVKKKAVIKKRSLLHEVKKSGKPGNVQIETGKIPANGNNVNDDCEQIQHSNVKVQKKSNSN
ncbi:hypothetical protein NQ314_018176 [Rhamnusium bicolor]|uniref:Uncharacterized protein n=1 Tax=Rhamnusium bicolor TaxID=1586634 RepID=A0AAV8WSC8_9CUCU|nr:hypothetical protein NQ314_018176 [Rhamnusium bicolor]